MADPHADYAAHDHVHGQMEISEQAKTWAVFKVIAKWCTFAVSVLLVFLVLWFCTGSGFLGALVGAAAVAVIGVASLRKKKAAAH